MASTISAGTSAGTAIAITGDTTGNLAFTTQAGANTITVPNNTGTIALTSGLPSSSQLCQAWVNFSTSTVNASYNVSSVTANGTGDYTVNFTNAFADNKYCYTLAAERASNNNGDGPKCGVRNGGVATGSIRVLIPRQTSSSGETYDTTWATVSVACFR